MITPASTGFSVNWYPEPARICAIESESTVFLAQPREIRWKVFCVIWFTNTSTEEVGLFEVSSIPYVTFQKVQLRGSIVTAKPLLKSVCLNPKGFQQDLFGSWFLVARISINRSSIPKPFGFSIETISHSMAGQIRSIFESISLGLALQGAGVWVGSEVWAGVGVEVPAGV